MVGLLVIPSEMERVPAEIGVEGGRGDQGGSRCGSGGGRKGKMGQVPSVLGIDLGLDYI